MTTRPQEIEQWSNSALVHPLSRSLAGRAIALGIGANAISVAGLGCLVAAASSFALIPWPVGALSGSILLFVSHVLDGSDGIVARASGNATTLGETIDGLCDHLGYAALYVAICYILSRDMGNANAILLTAVAVISHVVQANHYETRRRQYCYRIYGTPWIGSNTEDKLSSERLRDMPFFFRYPAQVFLGISRMLSSENDELMQLLEHQESPLIRRKFEEFAIPMIKKKAILGQNAKSIVLSLSMLGQCAVCYIIFVVLLLNAAMLILRVREGAHEKALIRELRSVVGKRPG